MTEESALTALLAAEHAAVYGYGVLGARLDQRTRELALRDFDAHRASRNTLDVVLRARSLTPPTPAASYDVAVANPAAALALAQRIESGLGVLWRDLVGATDDVALRVLATKGLQATTVRLVGWRRLAKVTPLVDPQPGLVTAPTP